ncbi:verprolin-like [Varroa destructor]|uniref:Uncharacterized protein n=1 Tax=Varroa destructor TaxID=109461 RepID=A0A7M7JMD4_VARDE|nr:verprolin-like [Varroa destructor]
MHQRVDRPRPLKKMRRFIEVSTFLLVVTIELGSCIEDTAKAGSGPTLQSGGRRRKDPTADLPDFSRDELLAILDLIEKSGDPSGKSPVNSPTKRPDSVHFPPHHPIETPTIEPRMPSDLVTPDPSKPFAPELPFRPHPAPTADPAFYPTPAVPTPTVPQYPLQPTPPNYPAPPPPTTPKPKKSFLDKLIRGFMKIISPQAGVNSRSAVSSSQGPPNFFASFLQQLQQTYQNSQQLGAQQGTFAASTQAAILDNLVKRLQDQDNEGSQFVVNLVQTLKSNKNPVNSDTASGPVNARTGGQAEQLLGALLRGIGSQQSQDTQNGQGGGKNFLQTFQRELFRSYNPSAGPTAQKSATDVLLDSFKQFLQNA